jgi:hypothetical protein
MRYLIWFFILSVLSSCGLQTDDGFHEEGKIRGRLVEASTGKPIPGIPVIVYSGAGSSGFFSSKKEDTQYAFSDENGYFQAPRMVSHSSWNSIYFFPDSLRWRNYLIAPSGYRNEQSIETGLYELFKPRILKLKVNYDTSKIRPPYENYDAYTINRNRYFDSNGSDLNDTDKNGFLILYWYPEVRRKVRLDYNIKDSSSFDFEMKFVNIENEICIGDTCYANIKLPLFAKSVVKSRSLVL